MPAPGPLAPPPRRARGIATSLRATQRESAFVGIMNGLTEPFMIPYALALGATSFQVGLLSSVRNLLISLVQLKAAEAVDWFGSRKALVLRTVAVQAVLWVPIALVHPLFGAWAVGALIACYTLGTASAALGAPAWGSLVSGYLPATRRGRFFGRRAQVVGLWTTVAALAAGALLHLTAGRPLVGFALLAAAAGASRLASYRSLERLHDEPWHDAPHLRFSFWKFARQVRKSNFARFSFCMGGLSFASHLSAPYFAVYLLRELGYGYFAYTAVTLAGAATAVLISPWWGRLGDVGGNQAVLRWTIVGVGLLPLLWPLSPHPVWLATTNVVGAFLWSGVNLAAANFLYDAVSPPKRHTCLAYFNVLNGLGVSLGAFVGGWALTTLAPLQGSVFVTLFYCSAVLRLLAALAFRRLVREVRPVRHVGPREIVYDLVLQRIVSVRSLFSAAPEGEERRLSRRRPRQRRRHP